MAKTKRSARIQEVREKSELSCISGLFSILDSHQSCANPKLISNGRPPNKLIIDYSRKLDQSTSFDEECRKIQYEANLASVKANASERSLRDLVREDMYIEKIKNKQIMVKRLQCTVSDAELIDHLLETQKGARKKSRKADHSNLYHLNNSARLIQSSRVSNGKRASFSVGEMKKKLKHAFGGNRKDHSSQLSHNRSIFGDDCIYRGVDARNPTNAKTKEKIGKKQGLKLERELDIALESDTVREKIDFSSGRLSKKHGVDVVLEANRQLSARLIDLNTKGTMSERSPSTLERIVSSLEHDFWPLNPRRDSQQMRLSSYSTSHTPNEKQRICLSPMRTNTEVTSCDDYKEYDFTAQILSTEMSSFMIQSTDEEAQDHTMDELKIIETSNVLHSNAPNDINSATQRTAKIKLHEKDGSVMQSTLDSVDDFPSTPTSASKYQEEQLHESPVSVLDQFFAEDINTPSSNMFQSGENQLKPLRLRFEECSFESSPQDYISHYVHLVIQSSSLDWDQLSKIRPLSEELLHSSLFDEVGFLLSDSHFDTRLLFDHMNEVLSKIQRSRFLSAPAKPRICCVPLEEVVLDEIMREADFYLLPRTQQRTLDQLVARDIADCRLWVDVRPETEHIMIHVSEDILEESILDVILEIHC